MPISQKWLLIVVAGIALAAGFLFYQFESKKTPAADILLNTPVRTLDGQKTRLETNGRWLIINFWATWCPSCVHEIPLLNAFARKNKNKLIVNGLAIDEASLVKEFMQITPIDYPVLIADLSFLNQLEHLGNPSMGLPFSLMLNPKGQIVAKKLGDFNLTDLAKWQDIIDAE